MGHGWNGDRKMLRYMLISSIIAVPSSLVFAWAELKVRGEVSFLVWVFMIVWGMSLALVLFQYAMGFYIKRTDGERSRSVDDD